MLSISPDASRNVESKVNPVQVTCQYIPRKLATQARIKNGLKRYSIDLSPSTLEGINEGMLAKLICTLWELDNQGIDGKSEMRDLIEVSEPQINSILADEKRMGVVNWLKVERHFRTPLFRMWLMAQTEAMERNEKTSQ